MLSKNALRPRTALAYLSLVWVVAVLSSSGCSSSKTVADQMIADQNQTNLHRLSNLYGYYQTRHGGSGPADEAEFRKFIGEQTPNTLKRMNIDPSNLDKLFKAERDKESFVIRWGVKGSERGEPMPVIFEKAGVNGKRMVGFTRPPHREVEDAEYEKLLKP